MNKQIIGFIHLYLLYVLLLIVSSCSKQTTPPKEPTPVVTLEPDITVSKSSDPLWYGGTAYFTYQSFNAEEVFRDGIKLSSLSGADSITNMTTTKVVEFKATAVGKKTAIKTLSVSPYSKKTTDLCTSGIWNQVALKSLVNGVWYTFTFACEKFIFFPDGKIKFLRSQCPGGIVDGTGDWHFVNNENELFLAQVPGSTPWTIIKLTRDSLVLTVPDNQGNLILQGYAH